jgi:hypothetical protein
MLLWLNAVVVKGVHDPFAVNSSTPPTSPIPPKDIDAFIGHAFINGHHGSRVELMLERGG